METTIIVYFLNVSHFLPDFYIFLDTNTNLDMEKKCLIFLIKIEKSHKFCKKKYREQYVPLIALCFVFVSLYQVKISPKTHYVTKTI